MGFRGPGSREWRASGGASSTKVFEVLGPGFWATGYGGARGVTGSCGSATFSGLDFGKQRRVRAL